eukprot:PITA_31948
MELGLRQWLVWENVEFYVKLATALFLAVLVASWSKQRKRRLLPPGPFPLPIIGNLHIMGDLPHRSLATLAMKYGPLMSLRLGSVLHLVVSSPEVAREFLKTHDQHFANRGLSAAAKHLSFNFAGFGFSSYSPYWRHLRKICTLELLSSKRLDCFRSIREEEASAMIRSINSDDSRPISIIQTFSSLVTAIICRMTFGRNYSAQDSKAFSSMVGESFLLMGSFNIGDYIPYLDWMDLQGLNRRLKKLRTIQEQLLEKVMDDHVARYDSSVAHDLVDVLLAASADKDSEFQISRDTIKAVVFDILLGGLESAPIVLEWAMAEALRNPPVMKKLQEELESVVGLDRMVSESDLPQLVYLQAMVKETIRFHPPGPFLYRRLTAESCNVLGYEIPKDTRVLINLWAIGRNPKSWEDPHVFKPERFMEKVGSEIDANGDQNFGCLLFGAGRRRCPGQHLGTLLVEFGFAQLLHCFNWRLPMDDINGKNQEVDMAEMSNGITMFKARELLAIPTPRLECIAHLK